MRTRLAAIALILAAARAAAIGPATEWQDVPPETTLSNAVAAAGLHRVAWSGDYNDLTNRPAPRRIAMFVIPVNHEASSSPAFVGFELKASTNNFSHAAGVTEDVRLQYYAQSEIADTGIKGSSIWDKAMLFVCTSHGSEDIRSYTRIRNTIEWPYPLTSVVVLVDASCLVRHPDGDWLREDNGELIWCYCRDRSMSPPYEQEPGTSNSLWRPIAPARWFEELPQWAMQM